MNRMFAGISSVFFGGALCLLSFSATAATSGAFSIDLGRASPISVNNTLVGSMDGSISGGGSGSEPEWISFKTGLRFRLPGSISLGGVINGTITSTNIIKGSMHTGNFSIDMSTLNNGWGPGTLLNWPEPI